MDVSTSLVTSANAGSFKFDVGRLFGDGVTASLTVGDGAMLVPDEKGYVGKQEFYRLAKCFEFI